MNGAKAFSARREGHSERLGESQAAVAFSELQPIGLAGGGRTNVRRWAPSRFFPPFIPLEDTTAASRESDEGAEVIF